MAAALQNAARTLGGRTLQRTQAAELFPRLIPGGSPATVSSSRMFGSSSSSGVPNRYKHMDDDASRVLMQLDQKKEELYNLLRKVTGNSKYRHPFWYTRSQNNRLQELLSLHVDVRPDDRAWRWDRRIHVTLACVWVAAIWHSGYMCGKEQPDDNTKSTSCPTEKQIVPISTS
nr:uncharacterized protein LOC127340458 [Lolium perenne]